MSQKLSYDDWWRRGEGTGLLVNIVAAMPDKTSELLHERIGEAIEKAFNAGAVIAQQAQPECKCWNPRFCECTIPGQAQSRCEKCGVQPEDGFCFVCGERLNDKGEYDRSPGPVAAPQPEPATQNAIYLLLINYIASHPTPTVGDCQTMAARISALCPITRI